MGYGILLSLFLPHHLNGWTFSVFVLRKVYNLEIRLYNLWKTMLIRTNNPLGLSKIHSKPCRYYTPFVQSMNLSCVIGYISAYLVNKNIHHKSWEIYQWSVCKMFACHNAEFEDKKSRLTQCWIWRSSEFSVLTLKLNSQRHKMKYR